jgi:hypothetical protein
VAISAIALSGRRDDDRGQVLSILAARFLQDQCERSNANSGCVQTR